MGLLQAIKGFFKHILPPPVSSFMREVNNLNDSIWRSKGELEAGTRKLSADVTTLSNAISSSTAAQKSELARLYDLFESVNRENLRLFFSSQQEREILRSTFNQANESLTAQLNVTQESNRQLLACLNDIQSGVERLLGDVESLHQGIQDIGQHDARLNDMLQNQNSRAVAIQKTLSGIRDTVSSISVRQLELLDPQLYEHALRMWYQDKTGQVLNLQNPRTYSEKIQWMKLYDKDPRKTLLADKLRVREWVAERIGSEHLIPLLGVYERAVDIDFSTLPNSFVLKANHGSGWNAVVHDKSKENLEALRWKVDGWLKTNFAFVNGYEMHYRDIPRCLLAEEYVLNANGDLPDYKFWCFAGKVHYIQYVCDRQTDLKMAFFDPAWNRLHIINDYPRYDWFEGEISKPNNLDEMISIAETLSEGFAHVRVDLYLLDDGSVKFGEMTFSTASGVCRWEPREIDESMGALIDLSLTAPMTMAE